MAIDQTNEIVHEGNWLAMYVVVALIPLVAGAIMIYSNWRDRASQAMTDEEIAAHAATYQRAWFPWRDAVTASENPRHTTSATPWMTTAAAATAGARPPPAMLPASFVSAAAAPPPPPPPPAESSRSSQKATPNNINSNNNNNNNNNKNNNIQVTVTAPTPEPPLSAAPPVLPAPAAYRNITAQQPYDDSNTNDDRWGEGPYGYGSNRNNMSRYTPTPTPTPARDFQDVPF